MFVIKYYRYSTIQDYLQANMLKEVRVAKDGLCMLHAVHGGMDSITRASTLSEEDIKHMVLDEFLEHAEDYMPYSAISAEETLAQVEGWAQTGIYTNDSADLILHILSQVLDLRLLIVQEGTPGQISTLELLPQRLDNSMFTPMSTVTLIKEGQHFNYAVAMIIVKKEGASYQHRIDSFETIVIDSGSDDSDTASHEFNPKKESLSPIE